LSHSEYLHLLAFLERALVLGVQAAEAVGVVQDNRLLPLLPELGR
jgi:hypothetical protein